MERYAKRKQKKKKFQKGFGGISGIIGDFLREGGSKNIPEEFLEVSAEYQRSFWTEKSRVF